jgi:2-succinyl-6-hydroxy-2,4-cyclohexadiene-1-carboxylate synthase
MKLSYESWGKGPRTVVALHGFTGNRGVWRSLERYWGEALRVIAVDLPGHGESAPAGALGFPGTVEALSTLIGELGLEKPTVLGYSLGARVALALAAAHPERLEKLILESGSPGLDSARERQARKADDEALAASIEQGGVASFVDRWEALPLFAGLRSLPEPAKAALRERRLSCNAEGLADSLRTLGTGVQPNLWPQLPRIRVPTLLLTGAEDVKFTTLARRVAGALPVCWRRTFPGVGHTLHLEAPEEYAAEVLAFVTAPWQEEAEFDVEEKSA